MKQTERIKHLVFCSILFSLEIIILLLTYFYSLFYYQLNWLSYLWYFVSWWSVQTDCLILLFALGGLIYFTKLRNCGFVTNRFFILYIVFAALLTFLFFTLGTIIGAVTGEKFTGSWHNIAIYWISTTVQHWVCPVIFIIYFCILVEKEFINYKDFCLQKLYKFYLHPIFYTIFIAVRQGVLLLTPVDEKLWNYSVPANNYYVPYFFQDFRHLEYYILYLLVLSIIIALLITFVVNLNNLLVNRQKIKEMQEKIN
ncbi:hypothetical protein [Spiroplasma melliferum]|uniref:Uncharacterized protein n=2 Tax=Spiroplasma melliferum TaxID=2134 RepID=A0AAI9T2R1_SPIME|nr:hypothetical protein [Spiroplasma melliferum]ELL44390.1 hypothetical protein SMIPMB4A_v3c6380 [Spiroplasma melliferum IPMB4A]KAI92055.1 hypothetical protein SPM_004780 [Spiroplasma melliferum KC3]QCO23467.1 hypothetical protein SRED_001936 [Spiroplasma melliferum]